TPRAAPWRTARASSTSPPATGGRRSPAAFSPTRRPGCCAPSSGPGARERAPARRVEPPDFNGKAGPPMRLTLTVVALSVLAAGGGPEPAEAPTDGEAVRERAEKAKTAR